MTYVIDKAAPTYDMSVRLGCHQTANIDVSCAYATIVAEVLERLGTKRVRVRTLSSTVSHFVTSMPSMPRSWPPEAEEKSLKARSNLVSWSTASFPTNASPTKMILSGLFVATNYGESKIVRKAPNLRSK